MANIENGKIVMTIDEYNKHIQSKKVVETNATIQQPQQTHNTSAKQDGLYIPQSILPYVIQIVILGIAVYGTWIKVKDRLSQVEEQLKTNKCHERLTSIETTLKHKFDDFVSKGTVSSMKHTLDSIEKQIEKNDCGDRLTSLEHKQETFASKDSLLATKEITEEWISFMHMIKKDLSLPNLNNTQK